MRCITETVTSCLDIVSTDAGMNEQRCSNAFFTPNIPVRYFQKGGPSDLNISRVGPKALFIFDSATLLRCFEEIWNILQSKRSVPGAFPRLRFLFFSWE